MYSNQLTPLKTKTEFYARAYVFPFFHQSWNLFVPPPNSNYKLFVSYEHNGKQHTDLFSEIVLAHQCNRLKGYESIMTAFTNSIYYFEKYTAQQNAVNGPIANDLNFSFIEHAAKNYLQYKEHIRIQHIKIIVWVEDSQTKKQRIYFN